VSHLRDVSRLAFTLRESRLLVEAGKALWFSMFGHPLHGDRLLWRPAKRTPLAPPVPAAITAERLQKQRASERRRRKRRGRARILRGALLRLKFRVRGARMRGGT
jgi:hypothetical protein